MAGGYGMTEQSPGKRTVMRVHEWKDDIKMDLKCCVRV